MENPTRPKVNAEPAAKSIFASRTFAGLALIVLPPLAARAGFTLEDADAQAIVEQLVQAVGLVLAAYGRLMATRPLAILPVGGPPEPPFPPADAQEIADFHEACKRVSIPMSPRDERARESGASGVATLVAVLLISAFICLAMAFLSGCTTVRENGRVVLSTSSDLRGLHFRTAAGTTLDAATLANSPVHGAVGKSVTNTALAVGTAVATSGITTIAR